MNTYIRTISILILSSIILSGHISPATTEQGIVEGVLVAEKTGKPVQYAHVYIVHGEEEALTNAKGEFRIPTSHSFPIILTIDHKDYQQERATITNNSTKLLIKLKIK